MQARLGDDVREGLASINRLGKIKRCGRKVERTRTHAHACTWTWPSPAGWFVKQTATKIRSPLWLFWAQNDSRKKRNLGLSSSLRYVPILHISVNEINEVSDDTIRRCSDSDMDNSMDLSFLSSIEGLEFRRSFDFCDSRVLSEWWYIKILVFVNYIDYIRRLIVSNWIPTDCQLIWKCCKLAMYRFYEFRIHLRNRMELGGKPCVLEAERALGIRAETSEATVSA